MDEDNLNLEIRKFLKKVGISSQRELEKYIRKKYNDGKLIEGQSLEVSVVLSSENDGLSHVIKDVIKILIKLLKIENFKYDIYNICSSKPIFIKKIIFALKNDKNVELRGFGTFRINTQKASIRRNPKTGEKLNVPKKRTIKWKMSKDLFKKLNNEKE